MKEGDEVSENSDNLENILNKVSKYLGKTPEEIKLAAKTGNTSSILNNFSKEDAKRIQDIITDKDLTQKLLSTKEAQRLVKDVLGGNLKN